MSFVAKTTFLFVKDIGFNQKGKDGMATNTKDVIVDGNEIVNMKHGFSDNYKIINEKTKQIEDTLISIEQTWSGPVADTYIKELRSDINVLNMYNLSLSKLIEMLFKSGDQYKCTEDAILEKVKSLRFYR